MERLHYTVHARMKMCQWVLSQRCLRWEGGIKGIWHKQGKGEGNSWRDKNEHEDNSNKLITIYCTTDLNRCMAHGSKTPAFNTTFSSTYRNNLLSHSSTMTSPNIIANAKAGGQQPSPAFGTSKVLYIGKERHPLTIQSLVPVSAPTFMKQSGFHSLVSTLRSHAAAYPSADLIAAIAEELPINTASASNEASIICDTLRRAPFDVNNLQPRAFFDDGGSLITNAVPFDPALRPPNVAFVNFNCTIRCVTIDPRIQQPDYSFNFSLKLPQTLQPQTQPQQGNSSQPQQSAQQQQGKRKLTKNDDLSDSDSDEDDDDYDADDQDIGEQDTVEDGVDNAEENLSQPNILQTLMQSVKSTNSNVDDDTLKEAYRVFVSSISSTPKQKKQRIQPQSQDHSAGVILNLQKHYGGDSSSLGSAGSSVPQGTSLDAFTSPKMSKLVSQTNKSATGNVYTYCGPLNFADSQEMFDVVFGPTPVMLQITNQANSNSGSQHSSGLSGAPNSAKPAQQFHEFVQRCHFDIFVALCESDYVGIVDSHSAQKATQEVCRKLQGLRQKFQAKSGRNQWVTLHPADLYNKYLSFVASLPPTASSWSIVLCKCYFDALIPELKEKMEENNFVMPDMTSLTGKNNQIQALRSVREAAITAYDNLQTERKRIMNLVQPSQNHQRQQTHNSAYYYSTNQPQEQEQYNQFAPPDPTQTHLNTVSHNQGNGTYNTQPHSQLFQFGASQSTSQAETTIRNHLQPSGQNHHVSQQLQQQHGRVSIQQLPSRVGSDGKSYPYNPQEPHILSDYPIGFRGCYGCGDPNHWKFRTECPLRNDPTARKKFWRNLWIHRPHTKRRPNNSAPNSPAPASPAPQPHSQINYYSNNITQPPPLPPANAFASPQRHNVNGQELPQEGILRNGVGRGRHVNTPAWLQPSSQPGSLQQQHLSPPPPLPPQPQHQTQLQQTTNHVTFVQEEPTSDHNPLFVTTATLLQHNPGSSARPMPLDLDNGLPGITMKFGKNRDAPTTSFLCHLDSCAGMSTGRLDVHKCIATKFPSIVAEWIEYTAFDPIKLDCAVEDSGRIQSEYGHLTHIVRYFTPYTHNDGSPVFLSFGLGKSVSVNAIIGLTDIRRWKGDISFYTNKFTAYDLRTEWKLIYKSANNIFAPPNFDPEQDFIRPNSASQTHQFTHSIEDDNLKTVNGNAAGHSLEPSKVVDSHEDGTFRRTVDLRHLITQE